MTAPSADPTSLSFKIELDEGSNELDFSRVFELFTNGSFAFKENELEYFLAVFLKLGNMAVIDQILANIANEEEWGRSLGKFVDILLILANVGIYSSKYIEYAASHFYDIIDRIDDKFPDDFIEHIISSNSLKIKNESSLFNLIKRRISTKPKSKSLLGFLELEYLSFEDIEEFVKIIDVSDIDANIWNNVTRWLCSRFQVMQNESNLKRYMINFKPNGKSNFDGIFNFFNKKSGGNCIENGTIGIKSTKMFSPRYKKQNIVDYSNFTIENSISFLDEPNGFITFDFVQHKVIPSFYSIHTSGCAKFFPKSWKLEGSEDENVWNQLDLKKNSESLREMNKSVLFEIDVQKPRPYRFIRFQTIGECYAEEERRYDCIISGLELYGTLL